MKKATGGGCRCPTVGQRHPGGRVSSSDGRTTTPWGEAVVVRRSDNDTLRRRVSVVRRSDNDTLGGGCRRPTVGQRHPGRRVSSSDGRTTTPWAEGVVGRRSDNDTRWAEGSNTVPSGSRLSDFNGMVLIGRVFRIMTVFSASILSDPSCENEPKWHAGRDFGTLGPAAAAAFFFFGMVIEAGAVAEEPRKMTTRGRGEVSSGAKFLPRVRSFAVYADYNSPAIALLPAALSHLFRLIYPPLSPPEFPPAWGVSDRRTATPSANVDTPRLCFG